MKKILDTIYDNIYPKLTDDEFTRNAVRGIVVNENNEIYLMHILCDDIFGHRDHFELPGGGIEASEDEYTCFKREMKEETGFECEPLGILGEITIEYHLLKRFDKQIYVYGKSLKYTGSKYTENEKKYFKDMIKVNLDTIEEFYKEHQTNGVGEMIHRRDLVAIIEYKKINGLNRS